MMPEPFKKLLETLPDTDADEVWNWLDRDGKDRCAHEAIGVIADSHPKLPGAKFITKFRTSGTP